MKKLFKKIKFNKNIACFGLFLLAAIIILGLPQTANADVLDETANVIWNSIKTIAASPILAAIGVMAALVMVLFGMIDTMIIGALVNISQYNNFINEPSIRDAWVVVRDLSNMFFILILLVIAFTTILRIESYQWKKMLPKLLIMAVLINFSRTICGLIIDASQVVMLTFVNTWATTGGDFVDMFKMTGYFAGITGEEFKKFTSANFSILNIVAGMLIGIMFLIISGIVLLVALAVFTMRVIMLWIYIVLSPLAFLLSAFPAGQKYASQWWSEFTKYVVSGPILAFFIWLALIASRSIKEFGGIGSEVGKNQCFGPTQGMCLNNFLPFIISIGMLLGGLMITQQVGGAVGSIAGKGLDWAKRSAKFVGKKTYDNYLTDKLHHRTGIDYNLPRAWSVLQERRAEKKKERYAEGQIEAGRAMKEGYMPHGILAMTGSPGDAWDQITHMEGIKPRGVMQRLLGGRRLKKWAGAMEPDLLQTEFESRFIGANPKERVIEKKKLDSKTKAIDKEITKEESRGIDKDKSKIENLEKEKKIINKQSVFAAGNLTKTFSSIEQKSSQDKAEKMRKEYNKYQPRIPFEARAAEQSVVAAKMSKIKDISAPSELLRMLQDAMRQHDKTMVKAITLKMTKDYNDNEFLQPLAGDTSHLGLKKLMREFADKGSKNYAGFGQQEAFALGSQIAELNKATNHWAATSAYTMENGRWRETTDAEHAMIRTTETGKLHPQAIMRNVNRLGFGKHKGSGSYELDEAGLLTLKQVDSVGGILQLKQNMTESTAQYLVANMEILEKVGIFSGELLDAIKEKAASVGDFDERYEQVSDKLDELRSS